MKTIVLATLIFAAFLLSASGAQAQQGNGGVGERLRAACGADYQRLCGGTPAGADRLKCLADNIDKASPDCRAVLASVPNMAAVADARAACAPEVQQYCPDAQAGGQLQCVIAHKDKLSTTCKSALMALRGMKQ